MAHAISKDLEQGGAEFIKDATLGEQEAAFGKVAPRARAMAGEEVKPMRAEPELIARNVSVGIASLLTVRNLFDRAPFLPQNYFTVIREELLAFTFAHRLAQRLTAHLVPALVDMVQVRFLRMLMAKSYDAAAFAGLVPAEPLQKILQGTGTLDASQDAIDLVALFREHQKVLAGRTPVTEANLAEAHSLAQAARDHFLVDGQLRASLSEDVRVALDDRDRLYTLVLQTYALGRLAGEPIFGREMKDRMPSPQSRRGLPKKAAKEKEPEAASG